MRVTVAFRDGTKQVLTGVIASESRYTEGGAVAEYRLTMGDDGSRVVRYPASSVLFVQDDPEQHGEPEDG